MGNSGKPLHFKGSTFHRVIKEFMCQGESRTQSKYVAAHSECRMHTPSCLRGPVLPVCCSSFFVEIQQALLSSVFVNKVLFSALHSSPCGNVMRDSPPKMAPARTTTLIASTWMSCIWLVCGSGEAQMTPYMAFC